MNVTQQAWVDQHIAAIDEDSVYASIGAYDPEAFQQYLANERERLTAIAIAHVA